MFLNLPLLPKWGPPLFCSFSFFLFCRPVSESIWLQKSIAAVLWQEVAVITWSAKREVKVEVVVVNGQVSDHWSLFCKRSFAERHSLSYHSLVSVASCFLLVDLIERLVLLLLPLPPYRSASSLSHCAGRKAAGRQAVYVCTVTVSNNGSGSESSSSRQRELGYAFAFAFFHVWAKWEIALSGINYKCFQWVTVSVSVCLPLHCCTCVWPQFFFVFLSFFLYLHSLTHHSPLTAPSFFFSYFLTSLKLILMSAQSAMSGLARAKAKEHWRKTAKTHRHTHKLHRY